MTNEDSLALGKQARSVLGYYLFDNAEAVRDDVAQICAAIDDALPDETRVPIKRAAELPREIEAAVT